MRVRDVMTREVITVDLDTPVSTAVSLLAKHNVTAVPVIGDERLVGMVSEADLLRHEIPHGRPELASTPPTGGGDPAETVADVMTTPVVAVSESTDTAEVAGLMLDYDVRSVPVVEHDRVTGIVSRRDLIRMLVHDDDTATAEIRRRLRDYSGDQDRWTVQVAEGVTTIGGEFDDDNERRVVELLARTVPGVRTVRTSRPSPTGSTGPDGPAARAD